MHSVQVYIPRVGEETNVEFIWEGGRQLLGIGDHAVIEEPRVSVQLCHLCSCRGHDSSVAVTHCGDTAVTYRIPPHTVVHRSNALRFLMLSQGCRKIKNCGGGGPPDNGLSRVRLR